MLRRRARRMLYGTVGGAIAVTAFAFLHDLFISDIWYSIGRMVLVGGVCGVSIVWSYQTAVEKHSTALWFSYNAACVAVLLAVGAVSFVVFDPMFTMAEMMVADDAMALLVPPALPLMTAASVVGAAIVWMMFGRRPIAIAPTLVTQVLLVFVVGHNLAFLGLVESTSGLMSMAWNFVGLTFLLGALYASSVMALTSLDTRITA